MRNTYRMKTTLITMIIYEMMKVFVFINCVVKMDFECMKKVVNARHSVRVFKKQTIPEGVLETILGYSLVIVISGCSL